MKRKLYKIHKSSLSRHKVKSQKELWEKLEKKGYTGMTLEAETKLKKSSEDDNSFSAIFSTEKADRHGDIVVQDWDLKDFKKNPVYLDCHNYDSIEHILGKIKDLKVKDKKLIGNIVFNLSSPKGRMARDMAENGFLNASSVGFIPLDFDNKGKITKSELLEISGVSVPANPDALIEKSKKKQENKENKEREEREEREEKEIKNIKTPAQKLKEALEKEIDIKEKALKRILTAIELIASETKGRAEQGNSQVINNQINKAVRVLLKLKK